MSTRVAFLRAVNLGKRTARAAQLVAAVDAAGYGEAWAFINSGNVVFDASGSRADIEEQLEAAFEAELGFEATTFVRTPAELRKLIDEDPFDMEPGDTHFVTFLKDVMSADQAKRIEALSNDFDTLLARGRDVQWHMKGKSSDSPLKAKDWDAIVGKLRSTSRNTTTLRKLLAKL